MKIAYVVYPEFTALDLIGPYEVISLWPDVELHWVATTPGPIFTDHGLAVMPTTTPADLPDPDVVVIPGSSKPLGPLGDAVLLDWVRQVAPHAQWLASACTGAAVYGAAGVLNGRRATTHWSFRENLSAMGVEVVADRVVFDPPFVTGAGVSAGIDMALALTARPRRRAGEGDPAGDRVRPAAAVRRRRTGEGRRLDAAADDADAARRRPAADDRGLRHPPARRPRSRPPPPRAAGIAPSRLRC